MSRYLKFLVFLLFWVLESVAPAAETVTLDELLQEVFQNNPDIRAAGYQVEAARARISQAKALDDPMVGVMFEEVPVDTLDVKQGEMINYRLEQKIPFPGKRHVKGKVARFDAQAEQEVSRGRIADVLLDLKMTYYEIYRLDRQLETTKETAEFFRQLLASTKTAYATGQTTADTPLKAQVELSILQNEEIKLKQERLTHLVHLKALLNRSGHDEIVLSKNIEFPHLEATLDEVTVGAVESRPELTRLAAIEERDRSKLTAARQGLLPDLSLGLEYNQRTTRQDAWTGTAMVNIPLYFWKNRAEIKEANASLAATRAENESAKIHTQHEIEQAYSAFRAAEEIVQNYEGGILPAASATLKTARTSYRTGKVQFLTLVDAARTLRDLKMTFYENQAGLGIAYTQLERLVGSPLNQKGESDE